MGAKAVSPVLVDNTRSRLIDAAGEVFAENGFQGATVREICARAGVNIALVNYHFGDKLELYTEVLRHSIGSPSEQIKTAIHPSTPPEEMISQTVHAMLQHMFDAKRPAWRFRLMVHELAQPTPALSMVVNEAARPVYEGMRRAVGELIGLPADHDYTRLAAHSIISQVVHYSHGRTMISQLWPDLVMTPERIEQIADHITEFSLAGLRQMQKSHKTEAHPMLRKRRREQRRRNKS